MFIHFYVKNTLKLGIDKYFKCNIALQNARRKSKAVGRRFINNDTFNEEIKTKLAGDAPFFCCRYGNSELTACFVSEMRKRNVIDSVSDKHLKTAKMGPGVFPMKEEVYMDFAEVYKAALGEADYNAYWGTVLMEEYMLEIYLAGTCTQFAMRALEPFQYEQPWTSALKGKKVLVVSPFAGLIKSQYENREKLFENKEILPEFELHAVTGVQSSGNTVPEEYADWSSALEALYKKCMNEDFEAALLSCGSYAVPLGARLKKAGKKVIVPGGMLQLMFGIKGKRWEESRPDIVALYNDYWVRAGGGYVVKDSDKMVDGPAYW